MKNAALFTLLTFLLLLSGCVAGQSIKMNYEPPTTTAKNLGVAVEIFSDDQRDFIISGDKQSNYIGHYRAGFGNTWDVTTENKQPLAVNLRQDVARDLRSLGFDVVETGAGRLLKITILDWNFDTYINGKMWYQIQVEVESSHGKSLAAVDLKETVIINGSVWVGAKYAFERELPEIYKRIVKKIVRDTPEILLALKSREP
jgi:uncharacterized lipoprotein YajG